MWKKRQLTGPPVCELKVTVTPFMKDTLNKTRNLLKKGDNILRDHLTSLSTEQYVLKRIIYKLSNQFRSEKSLRALKQMKSCLNRLDEADIQTLLTNIQAVTDVCPSPQDRELYLPSRQILQYNLVRLMGVAALLTQTALYSQRAFVCVRQHLEIGSFIPQNVIMLALTSRIWFVSKSLCNLVTTWYQVMFNCLDILQPTQVQWLPDIDVLPCDLNTWLLSHFEKTQNRSIDSEMTKSATTLTEMDTGVDMAAIPENMGIEDIGEPIQRNPDRTLEEKIQMKIKLKNRKNLQKDADVYIDICPNVTMSPSSNTELRHADRNPTGASSEGPDMVKQLKKQLKSDIKSFSDVDTFKGKIKAKIVRIGDCHIHMSKIGKKKILRKINVLRDSIPSNGPESMKEDMFVKKLRPVLSRMLVKYKEDFPQGSKQVSENGIDKDDIGELGVESVEAVDDGRTISELKSYSVFKDSVDHKRKSTTEKKMKMTFEIMKETTPKRNKIKKNKPKGKGRNIASSEVINKKNGCMNPEKKKKKKREKVK